MPALHPHEPQIALPGGRMMTTVVAGLAASSVTSPRRTFSAASLRDSGADRTSFITASIDVMFSSPLSPQCLAPASHPR